MMAWAGAFIKGFFSSIWAALRRKRQDQELMDNAHRQAELESAKEAIEASKKARKVDEKLDANTDSIDDLIDRL